MDDRSYPVIGNAMQTRLDWDRMVESHTTAFDFFVIVVVVVIVHALANLGDVPLWTSRPLGCKTNMNGWFTSIHKCLYVLLFVNDKIHSVRQKGELPSEHTVWGLIWVVSIKSRHE